MVRSREGERRDSNPPPPGPQPRAQGCRGIGFASTKPNQFASIGSVSLKLVAHWQLGAAPTRIPRRGPPGQTSAPRIRAQGRRLLSSAVSPTAPFVGKQGSASAPAPRPQQEPVECRRECRVTRTRTSRPLRGGTSTVFLSWAVSNHRRTTRESQRLADHRGGCGDAKGLRPERGDKGRDLEAASAGAERSRDRAPAWPCAGEREQPPGENGRHPPQGPPAPG